MTRHDWIAVGVDGSAGGSTATRWAAQEARRLDLDLRLVHVYNDVVMAGGLYPAIYPVTSAEGQAAAEQLLEDAAREAERILPRDRVGTIMIRSDRRAGLLQVAADARLMVLGDEPHPALERLITGSVVATLAAHSPTPVVAVPQNWQDRQEDGAGTVLVAIKTIEGSDELVRHGFRLAGQRQATLTLLHAWEFLAQYGDVITAHADLPAWQKRAEAALEELRDRIAPEFPGVASDVRLVSGQPARVLVDASAGANLLVITRRSRGFPFGHLGGTGRAVLRETRCPVVVLPPGVAAVEVGQAAGADGPDAG